LLKCNDYVALLLLKFGGHLLEKLC